MSGLARHIAGHAAEEFVARAYAARGAEILALRHRNAAGEIDLILRDGPATVFVEVKVRGTLDAAAHAISPRQWARIADAAQIYLAETFGAAATEMRFDAALLDRQGNLKIIENAAEFE